MKFSKPYKAVLFLIASVAAMQPLAAVSKATARIYEMLFAPLADGKGFALGANTLTNMIPSLYASLDIISRELVGFIPAVTLDANAARAAVGQSVTIPLAPAASASDITPGVTAPNDGDQAIGNTTITITKSRAVPFRWNGEEQLGLNNAGPGYMAIRNSQMVQAMRTLVNEIESDLAGLHISASRAFGTPGNTPFATNLGDPAQVRKILMDNGAPAADLQLVIDTTAGANMRTLAQLTKANEAGEISLLRQGVLLPLHGMDVRESAQIRTNTAGSVTNAPTASGAAGATTVTVTTAAGGAVNLVAGDIITFAGDTNKYVVAADRTQGASTSGPLVIAAPGLRKTISGAAITVVGAAARNMAFQRSAMVLAARAPALPQEGDMATDRMTITDPRSGLTFEVSVYAQYRQVRYEMAMAWGVKNIKPEHTALLLG